MTVWELLASLIIGGTPKGTVAFACIRPTTPAIGEIVPIFDTGNNRRMGPRQRDSYAIFSGFAYLEAKYREPGDKEKKGNDPGGQHVTSRLAQSG
jgi:hypothetical protein